MEHSYWHKQTTDKPLFSDIEWSKPEQRSQRGKLGIIGGNKLGFLSVAESYSTALKTGVGEVKVLLPDAIKKSIHAIIPDAIYGSTNPSGGLASKAIIEMQAIGDWASGIILIGDTGRNSETAILYEDFINKYNDPLVITRDAIDLIKNNISTVIDRPNTLIVASFAQLQKLFQNVYYPKVLTFSMQLTNLVEALHKFTITYPICVSVFHKDIMFVAHQGQVTSTPYDNPTKIWRGETATIAATYWLWSPNKPLESITASFVN